MELTTFGGVTQELSGEIPPLEGLPHDRGGVLLWRLDASTCGALLDGLPEDGCLKLHDCTGIERALTRLAGRRLGALVLQGGSLDRGVFEALAAIDCGTLCLPLGTVRLEDFRAYARTARLGGLEVMGLWTTCEAEERAWMEAFGELRSLEQLRLSYRATPPHPFLLDLGPLGGLTNLRSLFLEDATRVGSLEVLRRFERLRSLHLSSVINAEDALVPLESLGGLEDLVLERSLVVDADLVRLARLPRLRRLGLRASYSARSLSFFEQNGHRACGGCTGEGFAAFSDHDQLSELGLSHSDFPTAAFAHVARIPRLARLDLCYCRWLNDTALDDLCGLRLEHLRIDLTNHLSPQGWRRLFQSLGPALARSKLVIEEGEDGTTVNVTDLSLGIRESKTFPRR